MLISVPAETAPGETRVALVPRSVTQLVAAGAQVTIQAGAGAEAGFPDAAYREVGAELADDRSRLLGAAVVMVGDFNRARLEHAKSVGFEPVDLAGDAPLGERTHTAEVHQAQIAATIAALLGKDYRQAVPAAADAIVAVLPKK